MAYKKSQNHEKKDIPQAIADKFVDIMMQEKILPWRRPWSGGTALKWGSGESYKGINQMALPPGEYLSFNMAKAAGGHVKAKAKSHLVVFKKPFMVRDKSIPESEFDPNDPECFRLVPFLRYSMVFEVSQCEGINRRWTISRKHEVPENPQQMLDSWLKNLNVPVHDGPRACYYPSRDEMEMPSLDLFDSYPDYFSTCTHEMGHATGHASRLNRFAKHPYAPFGSTPYAYEELIAETCASLLSHAVDVDTSMTTENSESYLQGWATAFRDKGRVKELVSAVWAGMAAARFLYPDLDHALEIQATQREDFVLSEKASVEKMNAMKNDDGEEMSVPKEQTDLPLENEFDTDRVAPPVSPMVF